MKYYFLVLTSMFIFSTSAHSDNCKNYEAEVLKDTPIGYWRLVNPINKIALDSSGNNYHRNYRGNITKSKDGAIEDCPDRATSFASTEGTEVHLGLGILETSAFSIEAWFKQDGEVESNVIYRLRYYGNLLFVNPYTSTCGKEGHLGAGFYDKDANLYCVVSPTKTYDGKWHHAVATYDQSILKLYLDGTLVDSLVVNKPVHYNGFAAIGRDGNGGRYFNGSIQEFAYYDYTLDPARVFAHYKKGVNK